MARFEGSVANERCSAQEAAWQVAEEVTQPTCRRRRRRQLPVQAVKALRSGRRIENRHCLLFTSIPCACSTHGTSGFVTASSWHPAFHGTANGKSNSELRQLSEHSCGAHLQSFPRPSGRKRGQGHTVPRPPPRISSRAVEPAPQESWHARHAHPPSSTPAHTPSVLQSKSPPLI